MCFNVIHLQFLHTQTPLLVTRKVKNNSITNQKFTILLIIEDLDLTINIETRKVRYTYPMSSPQQIITNS